MMMTKKCLKAHYDCFVQLMIDFFPLSDFPVCTTGGPLADVVVGLPMGPELRMEPYFAEEDFYQRPGTAATAAANSKLEPRLSRNITVNSGQTAYLECKVRNLGAKQVRIEHTLIKSHPMMQPVIDLFCSGIKVL